MGLCTKGIKKVNLDSVFVEMHNNVQITLGTISVEPWLEDFYASAHFSGGGIKQSGCLSVHPSVCPSIIILWTQYLHNQMTNHYQTSRKSLLC